MNHADMQGPAPILQMLQGAQVSAIVSTAIELGVFGALASGSLSEKDLATKIHCPQRSTRILTDALVVLGLAKKDGTQYGLTPLAAEWLDPTKPTYVGDITGIFCNPTLVSALAQMPKAVKNDGSVLPEHAETPKHPFWESFAKSSAALAVPAANALDGAIGKWIESKPKVKVLDIAAGSGIYGFTLAKKHANVELTALDWPNVLAQTKEWQKRLGVDANRVKYIEGNLFEVAYGGPYDIVLLSHVYHHFDPKTCQDLTKKVASAVGPGGRVVVQDMMVDGVSNPGAVLFSVTMLNWTKKGEAYGVGDYTKWLTEAGFKKPDVHPSAGMPATFLVADKP
jgi:C-methyltransferase